MHTASRLLSVAILFLLGSAAAQSIDTVASDGMDPSMGSLGSMLTISGTGLGGPTAVGKPSAFLIDPVTSKKFTLKLVSFSDTEIVAEVTKAAYGALNVNVQPKGGELLTAVGAFTVPDPEITSVEPMDTTGTLGTTVTITGTGLYGVAGKSKPKVQLFNTATNKKYALKVLTFSDTEVTATIAKAVAATMELQLIPKAGATLVAAPAFVVPLPNISLVTPGFAFANETVVLTCEQVGNKKPKVKIGKKTAKVTAFSDTEVTFVMPKKLSKGVQTLSLTTKIGTATFNGGIIAEGETPDIETTTLVTATLGKLKFVASYPDPFQDFAVVGIFDPGPPAILTVTGNHAVDDAMSIASDSGFSLLIPFDPDTFVDPIGITDDPDGVLEFQYPDTSSIFAPPLARWSSDTAGGTYSFAILSVEPADGGQLLVRGAFSGTLPLIDPIPAPGFPTTQVVTDGLFRVLVDTGP